MGPQSQRQAYGLDYSEGGSIEWGLQIRSTDRGLGDVLMLGQAPLTPLIKR